MTPGKSFLRKGLVVSQFTISIILIIATLVIFRQLDYLNSRSLGYDRNQVVTLPYYRELAANYDAFYNELTRSTAIKNVARSSRIPTGRLLDSYGSARVLKGDSLVDAQVDLKTIITDTEFFDTYSIRNLTGKKIFKRYFDG